MLVNPLSLHHNYISAAHMQINAFINSNASNVLGYVSSVQELCQTPKIILSSEPTSLNRFQVKDTYCGNSLPGPCCCTFPRTIYIIHCLRPESRDLYKEQADRQRENRWHFISCRERERQTERECKMERVWSTVCLLSPIRWKTLSVQGSLFSLVIWIASAAEA